MSKKETKRKEKSKQSGTHSPKDETAPQTMLSTIERRRFLEMDLKEINRRHKGLKTKRM